MTVGELIAELLTMPSGAEVYFTDGPWEGMTMAEEMDPHPSLCDDGRVKL